MIRLHVFSLGQGWRAPLALLGLAVALLGIAVLVPPLPVAAAWHLGPPAPAGGRPAPPSRPAALAPGPAVLPPAVRQWLARRTGGLALRYGARTWTVPGAALASGLRFRPGPVGAPAPTLAFDPASLVAQVAAIAADLDTPARDARFRLVDGRVRRVADARAGQAVDRGASLAAARAALADGLPAADLVVVVRPPSVPDSAGEPGPLSDRLGWALTTYHGSSPQRAHNVEFGAALVDGALIAPGQEFDLNATLGPLTLDAGFQMGFAIEVAGDAVTTVPAAAGGICQVATTLFQSVFWAGLPITERNHHSYWISSYGQAPSGLRGLDATIAPPEADFRWRNTTAGWILVRARAGGGVVRFELWGTDPHWRVQVAGPVITHVVPADLVPVYERSTAIPRGEPRLVEHAQPGFTADIRRRVWDARGTLIDDWHAWGTYLPAHNRYLVGR